MIRKLILAILTGVWLTLCALGAAEAPTEAPAESPEPQAQTTQAPMEEDETPPSPAKGYVLVTSATRNGILPLPEAEPYSYELRQVLPDGTETVNVIHVTPDGVCMEDSTCENHDCVNQGTVTLDNRKDRILSNMIICLPNQVYLELLTPEEILERVKEQ